MSPEGAMPSCDDRLSAGDRRASIPEPVSARCDWSHGARFDPGVTLVPESTLRDVQAEFKE